MTCKDCNVREGCFDGDICPYSVEEHGFVEGGSCPFKLNDCFDSFSEEQINRMVDATDFSRYVNSAINYNGRLPTDEEYEQLKRDYYGMKGEKNE